MPKKAGTTRRELKQRAVQYKGGRCEACGYNRCLAALTFHHKDPKQKDFGISEIKNVDWPILKREISKCFLLCSNCHYEAHSGLLDGYT